MAASQQPRLFSVEPVPPRMQLRMAMRSDPGPSALSSILAELEERIANLTKELCALLLDPEEEFEDRLNAAEALATRRDQAAIPALLIALVDVGPGWVGDALLAQGPTVAEHALQWITSTITKQRLAAALAFGKVVDPRSAKALLAMMHDQEPELRNAACWALAHQRCQGALPALVHALRNDPSPSVRRAAAESLALLGDPRADKPLARAMHHDREKRVRQSAVTGLGWLATNGAKTLLANGPVDLHNQIQVALTWHQDDTQDEPDAHHL